MQRLFPCFLLQNYYHKRNRVTYPVIDAPYNEPIVRGYCVKQQ